MGVPAILSVSYTGEKPTCCAVHRSHAAQITSKSDIRVALYAGKRRGRVVPAVPCMMARFPQQRGLVSALAVGLAMTTKVAAFRVHSSMRALSSSSYRRPTNSRWRLAWSSNTNSPSGAQRPLHGVAASGKRMRMSTAAPAAAAAPTVEVVEEELPTNEGSQELLKIRHTSAHVMAMAVQNLFPETQVTIGPWIDNGFYYDFFTGEKKMTDSDLKLIKKEMDKIIRQKLPLVREEVTREEARTRIEALGEPFKMEILDAIKTEPITIYHVGDQWWDLCAGPHVETTGDLPTKAIELQTLAGAYWRGDEKKAALQRIYGTAWQHPAQLKEHKRRMVEAKRRDHRVLGKKLDLFSLQEDAGGGLVFWHPKGSTIRRLIEDFWKSQHLAKGYELLYTPHVANLKLWKTSGHFDFYKEGMFDQMDVEGDEYQIKPMNCPFHCLVYKDDLRSYRDLPIRWAELGTVYRYERSGTLHGLMRVRGFTQDDAHIFCLPEQLEDEIVSVLDLTEAILNRFGFDRYEIMLSTRPEKSVGTDAIWDLATEGLKGALKRKGWAYTVDEGGGAFYGPKIDLKIRDAIGRTWQCSTVQADFNLPDRFNLEYIDSAGEKKQPVMLHRAIFGSIERFFGILVENTAGTFPLWLAPEQMRLLPVTDAARDYCLEVQSKCQQAGLRVKVDRGSERLAKQIRTAEKERIPVMSVVGEKEIAAGTLAVRSRGAGDLGDVPVDELIAKMLEADAAARELHEFLAAKPAAAPEVASDGTA